MTVIASVILSLASVGTCDVPLPSDLNRDCVIDFKDVQIIADYWLTESDLANLNDDDRVDIVDYATLSRYWGNTDGCDCNECENWRTLHPEWIFCDDFDGGTPLVREGRYFEYGDDSGDFVPLSGVGINSSTGMRTIFQIGEVGAGGFKLAFGRVPGSYFDKGIRYTEDFRDIYYRIYLKNQIGWEGSPAKLSRATVFTSSNWSQAMIAHLWSSGDYLLIDPASGTDEQGNVITTRYNDFANLRWLVIKKEQHRFLLRDMMTNGIA